MITLSMLLERQRRKKIVVIAGDFNVHEGKKQKTMTTSTKVVVKGLEIRK